MLSMLEASGPFWAGVKDTAILARLYALDEAGGPHIEN